MKQRTGVSHPADVLQNQLHLVGVDGRQDEDEGDDVHAALGNVLPQIIFSQIALEGTAALGDVQRVLLSNKKDDLNY